MENDLELLKAARARDKWAALEKFEVYSSALSEQVLPTPAVILSWPTRIVGCLVKLMEQLELGKWAPENEPASHL